MNLVRPMSSHRVRLALALALLGGTMRGLFAVTDHGVFWPDEIFQSMEPAHRLVFGYGFLTWEFEEGVRSWLFPGIVSSVWWPLRWLGLDSGMSLVFTARLLMVTISMLGIAGCVRLACALGGLGASWIAGLWSAFLPLSLVYGHRCMAEVASATPLVWATVFMLAQKPCLSGALMGLAVFLRYQNGLWAVALPLLVLTHANRRAVFGYSGALTVTCLIFGMLDAATWGRPFHSLVAYVRVNLIEGEASTFGVSPFGYYFRTLCSATGPLGLLFLFGFLWSFGKHRLLGIAVVGYLLAHSFIPHKELRFLTPVVPVAAALAGVGTVEAGQWFRRGLSVSRLKAIGLSLALAAGLFWHTVHLTFEAMGQYLTSPIGHQSPFHHGEADNRLLWRAGRRADLCGLALGDKDPRDTGGYSYLHRDVPAFMVQRSRTGRLPQIRAANYLIMRSGAPIPGEFQLVERVEHVGLYRRLGHCAAPAIDTYLLRR